MSHSNGRAGNAEAQTGQALGFRVGKLRQNAHVAHVVVLRRNAYDQIRPSLPQGPPLHPSMVIRLRSGAWGICGARVRHISSKERGVIWKKGEGGSRREMGDGRRGTREMGLTERSEYIVFSTHNLMV